MKSRKPSAPADLWVRGAPTLREAVAPSLKMWRALLSAAGQDPLARRYRAWVLLARVRLWALFWAFVVPLWIPLDLMLIGGTSGRHLALGRALLALFLATAVWLFRCVPTQRNVRWAYALLFGMPLLFFVVLAPYFQTAVMRPSLSARAYLDTYHMFPLLISASIGLLPVTLFESAALVGACLLASVAGLAASGLLFDSSELGWLWILLVASGIGTLAGVSQTALMLQNFRDAATDPLTGLPNRRAGVNLLALQWEQARRNHGPFSVAMIDLDGFKRVNDTHGHEAGDRVLVGFAVRLRETLRAGDSLLRWGGEEFLAVLPGAESHDAVRRLEKMLHECPVLEPDGVPLTFSAGVAERGTDASSNPEALVALADRRMYEAKAAGRASVVAGPT